MLGITHALSFFRCPYFQSPQVGPKIVSNQRGTALLSALCDPIRRLQQFLINYDLHGFHVDSHPQHIPQFSGADFDRIVLVLASLFSVLGLDAVAVMIGFAIISRTLSPGKRRNTVQIVTAVLIVPLITSLGLYAVILRELHKEPPSLAELQRDFHSIRPALETLLRMSDEDVNFSRFYEPTPDRNPMEFGPYKWTDIEVMMEKSRWDEYRKIYSRNGIHLGLVRNVSRDAFIVVDSAGLYNFNRESGYLHCAPTKVASPDRYPPCISNQEKGERLYDEKAAVEGFSFQKIDDRWYAYDEGRR
jgi:hypothetical protein